MPLGYADVLAPRGSRLEGLEILNPRPDCASVYVAEVVVARCESLDQFKSFFLI